MTEHPELETPGGRIRAAREARELSLADLSDLTKIPPPVLAAIEADEYHKVSGALYIKSFLRSCAAELGLDSGEILDLYGRFSGELRSSEGVANPVWEEEEVQISHVGLPWRGLTLAGVALLLVGFGGLTLVRGCRQDTTTPRVEVAQPAVDETSETTRQAEPAQGTDVSPEQSRDGRDRPDTLAGAWVAARPAVPRASADAAKMPASGSPESGAEPVAARSLPLPLVGGPNLVFASGVKRAVVVRLISDRAVGVEIKGDAEQAYTRVEWPTDNGAAPVLPSTGIVPGRVYTVGRGFVLYWGADDHISLRLDRTDGVELTLNGELRNLRNLRPGAELLLDLSDH